TAGPRAEEKKLFQVVERDAGQTGMPAALRREVAAHQFHRFGRPFAKDATAQLNRQLGQEFGLRSSQNPGPANRQVSLEIAGRSFARERRAHRLHHSLKLVETSRAVVNADPDDAGELARREKAKPFGSEAERWDGLAGLPQPRRQISDAIDLHVAEKLQGEMN